jgi:capsular polysaccharide transport system ATP-binding protein
MIQLERVTKTYRIEGGLKLVLNDIDFVFPTGISVGVLGMNGAGKSTLLRLLSGADQPTSGRVRRNRRISWPVSLSGFNGSLTGEENVRFVSRDDLYQPTRTYSAGMRGRLSFALSLALDFDTYIVDEGHATGDARFAKRFNQEWRQRLQRANIIMVSHRIGTIYEHCTHAAILHQGKLSPLMTIDQAAPIYEYLLGV